MAEIERLRGQEQEPVAWGLRSNLPSGRMEQVAVTQAAFRADLKGKLVALYAHPDSNHGEREKAVCADCHEPHWYNFWVPDEVWARICPDQPYSEGLGGNLCVRCLDRRCAAMGVVGVKGRFFFKGDAVSCRMDVPSEQIEAVLQRYDEAPGEYPEDDHVAATEALDEIRAILALLPK